MPAHTASQPDAGRAGNYRDERFEKIADAHGRWRIRDGRSLGIDRLEVYERLREA
jgi:hypothetical protein